MKALIVGASGYNGGLVARRLLEHGHVVRGLVRQPARAIPQLHEVVQGDAITGAKLKQALTGIDVAFYYVHALDAADRQTDTRDLDAARQFVIAAQATGLPRGVFFTTLDTPQGVEPPIYQRNRLQVENILLDGIPGMTAVRTGMVIGADSRGVLPYIRLVQRFPIIPLGPWRSNRVAVIDPATATDATIIAGTDDTLAGQSLDAPACAQPTHQQLVRAIIAALGLRRMVLPTPVTTPRLDAALIAAVTGESYGFCRYLSSSNKHDYVIDDERAKPFHHLTPPSMQQVLHETVHNLHQSARAN